MSSKTYDRAGAEALTPLLASILQEIEERRADLRRLQAAKRRAETQRGEKDTETLRLVADVAMQKLELRRAAEELNQLGCHLEEGPSLAVRIPGPGEEGWTWQVEGGLEESVPAAA